MERCLLKSEHKAKGETDVVGVFKRIWTLKPGSQVDTALLPTCKGADTSYPLNQIHLIQLPGE